MNRRRLYLVLVGLLVVVAGWFYLRVNRGPHIEFLITREFHMCDRCNSLDGGIYGKGIPQRLRSDAGRWCVHEWLIVPEEEFNQRATEWFGE